MGFFDAPKGGFKMSIPVLCRTFSTKLARTIIDKVLKDTLSRTHINLLIYLALIQDCYGYVEGIYYKDVSLAIYVCYQTFYNALKKLEEKRYIEILEHNIDDSWSVRILNNVFATDKDDEKGYLNVNRDIFFSPDFKKMKPSEQKAILFLMTYYKPETGMAIYPKTLAEKFGLSSKSMAIIYRICDNIAPYFPNTRIDGKEGTLIYFRPLIKHEKPYRNRTEIEHFLIHRLTHYCRINKVAYTMDSFKKLLNICKQYWQLGLKKVLSTVSGVLMGKNEIDITKIAYLLNTSDENRVSEIEYLIKSKKKRLKRINRNIKYLSDTSYLPEAYRMLFSYIRNVGFKNYFNLT